MRKSTSEELKKYMLEIERLVENNKTPAELIRHKKMKIVRLGATDVRKKVLSFKEIKKIREERQATAAAKRLNLEFMGITRRRRRKR
jgi:hypothetical protein